MSILERQHWRGFPAVFAPKAAPMLESSNTLVNKGAEIHPADSTIDLYRTGKERGQRAS
jgi:hypothetical protein